MRVASALFTTGEAVAHVAFALAAAGCRPVALPKAPTRLELTLETAAACCFRNAAAPLPLTETVVLLSRLAGPALLGRAVAAEALTFGGATEMAEYVDDNLALVGRSAPATVAGALGRTAVVPNSDPT
jgi:hypothetical protein